MPNFFENILAAENHKKYFKILFKKIFEINALKLVATSNIVDELREIFRKIKDLKIC